MKQILFWALLPTFLFFRAPTPVLPKHHLHFAPIQHPTAPRLVKV